MVSVHIKTVLQQDVPPKKYTPTITPDEAVKRARLLRAFSDATRLGILDILCNHEEKICVQELVDAFSLTQPVISFHLRILRDAGLVDFRKEALYAYYYVKKEKLIEAQKVIGRLF